MLNLVGFGLGILLGLWTAYKRGGSALDLLHYATIFGLIGFVVGAFAMLVIPAPA
ncbi:MULTISPECIES: hypothetical protein [Paracoccaceae]|jgi:uncharacterized protein HemY|uniref:hypothetical protein n=1 Tax=Rhodobacterales TaxID=204455 RepID=UPI00131500F2|nr:MULTISPECIES: hypothetical protein [Paracoccaceae]MBO6604178.1 hypothetical protein [Roseicyclus sp.]MBO6625923.1 hypothetical protein [Roseicyclus sp.]MBO6923623.1 hypothetical protein [Roseicyclus sp.]